MSDKAKKYRDTLGINTQTSPVEIKRVFKSLAFQYHPDRNPHNEMAEEKFKAVVEAYSYLSGNMEAYQALQSPVKKAYSSVDQAQDIYKILFDIEWTPAQTRPRPLVLELLLSLTEAFQGGEKRLVFERQDLCSQCMGSGIEAGAKTFTCTYCFGEGEVEGEKNGSENRECPKCNGRGFLSSRGCIACRARGVSLKTVKQKIAYPRGVASGQVLEISGAGHEFSPGQRGVIQVSVCLKPDPRFSFDGRDIICETTVPMAEAALGGQITVPTLQGAKKISLPAGIQSGQVVRLKGLGLGGDQFVRVWVRTPKVVSEQERKLIQNFNQYGGEEKSGFWARFKKWIW